MPRIDPIQLLNCLSVLLSPNGGIKSRDEVQRLASLMTKFSKKLVSKCIYIQILKCTETELLGLFMGSGGWRLVHMWLTESIVAKNWPLVRELLELLLLCPVDIERLKTNNCPKLVKELSKDGNHFAIRALASKLVEQWLKTVKGENMMPVLITDIPQIISEAQSEINTDDMVIKIENNFNCDNVDKNTSESEINHADIQSEQSPEPSKNNLDISDCDMNNKEDENKESETLPVLKITLKDGKQVISQVDDNEDKSSEKIASDKDKLKEKHRSKEKSHDKKSSRSRSSSSKHSSKTQSSSNDKHKSSTKTSSPSRHSSRDKSKDKHSSRSSKSKHNDSTSKKSDDKSSSSSSSRSKDDRSSKQTSDKDKNKHKIKDDKNEKDKESKEKTSNEKPEEKSQPPSIQKLGKIPKLSDVKKEKPSISIEVRKPDEPKPKTVKTFNSKFRKHGLEEEVKPPPSRASLLNKKVPPVLPPTIAIPKRPSPVHNETPPEKKIKTLETIEKPGAIKLIPPKPKRPLRVSSIQWLQCAN